jgi:hypothetical protein
MDHSDFLHDAQEINVGHLNVQEEEIYGLGTQIGDRFGTVLALGYDVHIRLGRQQQLQPIVRPGPIAGHRDGGGDLLLAVARAGWQATHRAW